MNEQFYYARDGKRHGPIAALALRELAVKGQLRRSDRIWCKGMNSWQAADSVEKLFEDLPPDLETEPGALIPAPLPEEAQFESVLLESPATMAVPVAEPSPSQANLLLEAQATGRANIQPAITSAAGNSALPRPEEHGTKVTKAAVELNSVKVHPRIIGILAGAVILICLLSVAGPLRFLMDGKPSSTTPSPPERVKPATLQTPTLQTPSPEAIRNNQAYSIREQQFEADSRAAKEKLEAMGYNSSAAAALAPKIVEEVRRKQVELEFQHGGRASDQQLDDLEFAKRKANSSP